MTRASLDEIDHGSDARPSPEEGFDVGCAGIAAALPAVRRAVVLRLGRPGDSAVAFALRPGESSDHTLRTDVVAALLRRCPAADPWVWLTRDGGHQVEDSDAGWYAAARAAFAEAGRPLRFVVVTPEGWVLRG
ncbi:hypothetical protein [Nocardioides ferulae]|uniref:hypothetical protein n=1 Tax=Nocardioides ferulae TaxID=2340821 RepID=UPI000EB0818A|nr:hypothetical protein [Nocardioides ferulae]